MIDSRRTATEIFGSATTPGWLGSIPAPPSLPFLVSSDKPGAVSSPHVNSSFVDSHGHLWAATQNGLDRLNADGSFTVYGTAQGLATNALSCILEDDAGSLWMSTAKGISRFNPQSRTFTNYLAADGLGDLQGWAACLKRPDGEMFFGGYAGLIAFYPTKGVDTPSSAPIRLSELKINGQSVQVGPASPLKESIASAREITLSNQQRNFSLEFASLNFVNSGATRYRYKLDTLDSQWIDVDSDERVVSFTGLPSGTYIFRAQAAVGRGSWSEPGVALRIQVLPPWWRSWWLTTLVSVLLLFVAGRRWHTDSAASRVNMKSGSRSGSSRELELPANCTIHCCRGFRAWCCGFRPSRIA